ncbi:MAG: glycosyltransferase [Phycisphaerales bacterium]|nr:glycosyltransferase [Phycisphaerales bacterium]
MRVLILADEVFASRERALVTRLEVGFADEGVRVLHAVPERAAATMPSEVHSQALTYAEGGLLISRAVRVRKLIQEINTLRSSEEERAVDIVHVFGGAAWSLGIEVARQIGAGLALDVWRAGLVSRARTLRVTGQLPPVFFSPDPAIERLLLAEDPGIAVRSTPWGVHTPDEARPILRAGRAPTAMVVGGGRDLQAFGAALRGLAVAAKAHPDLMIFMDPLPSRATPIARLARDLGLRRHLSMIEGLENRRDLLLQGDLLIQPESGGEQRSIVLDAMASGLVVVAAQDPLISTLIDGVTAYLVKRADAGAWGAALRGVLERPELARSLVTSARQWVRQHRRASDHVRTVLEAYAWMTSKASIPFPAQAV